MQEKINTKKTLKNITYLILVKVEKVINYFNKKIHKKLINDKRKMHKFKVN